MACLPLGHLTDDDPEPVVRRSSTPAAARTNKHFFFFSGNTRDGPSCMVASGNIFLE